MKVFNGFTLILTLIMGLLAANAQALLLDDFTTGYVNTPPFIDFQGPDSITLNAPSNQTDSGTQTGNMLGGSRDILFEVVDATAGSGYILIDDGTGLQINSAATLKNKTTVTYNFGSTNFKVNGERGMEFGIVGTVDQVMDVVISLTDSGMNTATSTVQYPNGYGGSTFVYFDDFVNGINTDFTALTQAVLSISSPTGGLDTAVSFFKSIPEPDVLLLMLIGLFAGFTVKKNRLIAQVKI